MNKIKLKILLAEDDVNLGVLLLDFLELEGYDITLCVNGELAIKAIQSQAFDLYLLDVMLPKIDGFTLASEIRKHYANAPFIFITAKSLKEDKLKGYVLGADDYITKPFDEEELLWKIRAVIRRLPENSMSLQSTLLKIGSYQFDVKNQCLVLGEQTKRITEKECDILLYLFKNCNRVIKRDEMLNELWGDNDYFLGRSLDVFISKLRKYLSGDSQISIENVFGVGFIFNIPNKSNM